MVLDFFEFLYFSNCFLAVFQTVFWAEKNSQYHLIYKEYYEKNSSRSDAFCSHSPQLRFNDHHNHHHWLQKISSISAKIQFQNLNFVFDFFSRKFLFGSQVQLGLVGISQDQLFHFQGKARSEVSQSEVQVPVSSTPHSISLCLHLYLQGFLFTGRSAPADIFYSQ